MDARMEMLKMKENASTIPPARESPVGRDGNGAGPVRAEFAADADMDVEVDVIADNAGGVKALDKRSFEYIFRSGLAGGLAGCAVCFSLLFFLFPFFLFPLVFNAIA